MILNKGPPSEFETSNKISNSGGTDMYIEHPYFYEGKYYARCLSSRNKQEGVCHRNKRSSENHETKEETSWNGIIGGILENGRIYKRTDSKSR